MHLREELFFINMRNYLIIVPEEFSATNHKELFFEIARMVKGNARVIVLDIAADAIVSRVRHRTERIKEAKQGAISLLDNMYRIRPYFPLRPEITPYSMLPYYARSFWKHMEKSFPNIMKEEIKVLCYNLSYLPILVNTHPHIEFSYYATDEWRRDSDTGELIKKVVRLDDFACKHCKVLYVASEKIKQTRIALNNNIYVTGNGATYHNNETKPFRKFNRSVGFIGHFRDWIDVDLLRGIIASKPDVFFGFLGKVQPSMQPVLENVLNDFENTAFFGKVKKEDVSKTYRMFDCVMVPYVQNDFMQNTRPIKIVESVFAGTPVVTIPMGGHQEHSFIRFATGVDSFCEQIEYLFEHPIDKESEEFKQFIEENGWKTIASTILETL